MIVAIAMVVVVGVAALAIDASSWHVKHHQAQVAADSAALAAANCLANAGPGDTCTSTTDTTDATTVATKIAKDNGITLPASDISYPAGSVKITAPNPAPGVFSALFGIKSTTQTASAVASYTAPAASPCTSAGNGCDFMFADYSGCQSSATSGTAGSPNGIYLDMTGNATISGDIQSNGNLSGSLTGNATIGTTSYGTGDCANKVTATGNINGKQLAGSPWTDPTQAGSVLPYPLDYSQDFPACSGTACTGPSGTPAYCTYAAANFNISPTGNGTLPSPSGIYCAYGSSLTPSDPSTWTGSITIKPTGNYSGYGTFVGETIDFDPTGNFTLSACGYSSSGYNVANCASSVPAPAATPNYPLFYAIGTSSSALKTNITGNSAINGDLYAPKGGANITMTGNATDVTFIEALSINGDITGNVEGDGPKPSGGAGSARGTDSLTQ